MYAKKMMLLTVEEFPHEEETSDKLVVISVLPHKPNMYAKFEDDAINC